MMNNLIAVCLCAFCGVVLAAFGLTPSDITFWIFASAFIISISCGCKSPELAPAINKPWYFSSVGVLQRAIGNTSLLDDGYTYWVIKVRFAPEGVYPSRLYSLVAVSIDNSMSLEIASGVESVEKCKELADKEDQNSGFYNYLAVLFLLAAALFFTAFVVVKIKELL